MFAVSTPWPNTTRSGEPTKRERTRRQLLVAAVDAIATEGEAFTVLDVTRRAGVSNGTFYNHFVDRDALIDAVVAEVVGNFTATSAAVVAIDDPARRFATITAMFFERAATLPKLARVGLRLESMPRTELWSDDPLVHLRVDLERGHADGRLDREPTPAVIDVVIGTMLRTVRRIATGDGTGDRGHRQEVITLLLRAVGVEADEARGLAIEAVETAPDLDREVREAAFDITGNLGGRS